MNSDPRYPTPPAPQIKTLSDQERREGIAALEALPAQVREAVAGRSNTALDTPYHEGGWTLRQVVHHLADAHLNAYIRFKLTLTEPEPTIQPWREERWATLPDAGMDMTPSLTLLDSVHMRLVALLSTLLPAAWKRTFIHPDLVSMASAHTAQAALPSADGSGRLNLDQLLAVVVRHGRHHTAHILQALENPV